MKTEQLLKQAALRWDEFQSKRPDLTPAIDLQRRLVSRNLELGATIDGCHRSQFAVTPAAPAAPASKLQERRPVFAGEMLELDSTALKPFVLGFCEDFASSGAGNPADHLHGVLKRGESRSGRCCQRRWSVTRRLSGQRHSTLGLYQIYCGS